MRTLIVSIFLWISTLSMSPAGRLCDVVEGFIELSDRLYASGVRFGNKLANTVRGTPDLDRAPRFRHVELTPEIRAQDLVNEALGAVESIAPGELERESIEAFVKILLLKRVIEADGVSYDTMGEGLAKFMDRFPVDTRPTPRWTSNTKARDMLEILEMTFKRTDRVYLREGYTEAQYLRDMATLFEDTPDLDGFDASKFLQEQASGGKGRPLEVRVAASKKSEGIVGLAVDDDLTGVDVWSEDGAYNVAYSYHTVADKIKTDDQRNAIAKAIIDAHDYETPYKFVIGEPLETNSELQARLDKLNAIVASTRPDVAPIEISDIEIQSFK